MKELLDMIRKTGEKIIPELKDNLDLESSGVTGTRKGEKELEIKLLRKDGKAGDSSMIESLCKEFESQKMLTEKADIQKDSEGNPSCTAMCNFNDKTFNLRLTIIPEH